MNIAKGKSATQSSNHNPKWGADKAVDGYTNKNGKDREVGCDCCSHTYHQDSTAWWQVDLKVPSRIQTVKIFYRKPDIYAQRLAGFSLYLTNTTERRDNLCYKDSGPALPDPIQTIDCPYTATYVYIYNERLPGHQYPANYSKYAILELCEVEVYGCPLLKYGKNCSKNCSIGCQNKSYVCEPDTGNCTFGCKEGFRGLRCDACEIGRYGDKCEKNCSVGCKGTSCNRSTGECDNGCTVNYAGIQCRGCIDGKYGGICHLNCSKNCLNITCHQNTGNCNFGCNANWNGSKCQACSDGRFGVNCNKRCSEGCQQGGCVKNSGHCNNGCVQGFDGDNCSSCTVGLFGNTCEQNCSENCHNLHCNRQTGRCIEGCTYGWGGDICNVSLTPGEGNLEGINNPAPTVIGVLLTVILVIGIMVLIIVLIKRRRSTEGGNTSKAPTVDSVDQIAPPARNSHDSGRNGLTLPRNSSNPDSSSIRQEIYENTAEVYYNFNVPGIPVKEIKDYISQKSREDFQKEYGMLPDGTQFPYDHSKRPNNKLKNRFQKAYCYDHSRVVLKSIPGEADSDYINANYIDRVDTPKYYIATQGPKDDTVRDFWRMVWHVKSSVIIMLTNLTEKGKIKCSKYWPESDTPMETCGLKIASESAREFATYTIREFRIENTRGGGEYRKVIQYHFTAWPDHGTPDPIEIIVFAHKIISRKKDSPGPYIVHCSAGIGRTGTYLAFDALFEYGKRTGRLNIFEYVKNMRKDRMNMVQTLDQYIFLNEVFTEAFDFEDTSLSGESLAEYFTDFSDKLDNGTNPDQPDRIQTEFKNLQSRKRSYGREEFKASLLKKNRHKIKPNCPMASEQYRPFINSRSPGGTNYFNAVLLPSFNKKAGYAVSHFPLLETVVDLVLDHRPPFNNHTLIRHRFGRD